MPARKVMFIHLTLAAVGLREMRVPTADEYAALDRILDTDSHAAATADFTWLESTFHRLEGISDDQIRNEMKKYIREESREPRHVLVFILCDQVVAVFGYWVGPAALYENTVQRDFLAIHPGTHGHIKTYIHDMADLMLKETRSDW